MIRVKVFKVSPPVKGRDLVREQTAELEIDTGGRDKDATLALLTSAATDALMRVRRGKA